MKKLSFSRHEFFNLGISGQLQVSTGATSYFDTVSRDDEQLEINANTKPL